MSPLVMQYRALEKWNGRLPMMNGSSSIPMLTFDLSKAGKEDDSEAAKMLKEIEAEEAAEAAKDKDKPAEGGDAPKQEAPKQEAPKPQPPKK
jgi:hypothetical protein